MGNAPIEGLAAFSLVHLGHNKVSVLEKVSLHQGWVLLQEGKNLSTKCHIFCMTDQAPINSDPHHMEDYQKHCNFLPELEAPPSSDREDYQKNFQKLADVVLIGGPDDGVITPWQSR